MTESTSPLPFAHRLVFAGMTGLLGLAATLAMAEGGLRLLDPTPRVQIVRADHVQDMRAHRDTVVWRAQGSHPQSCAEAPEAAVRVAFVGSSIFFGSGVPAEQAVSAKLGPLLAERLGRPVCVDNPSQPAFTGAQKRAVALDLFDGSPPDLLYWEVWANDPGNYQLLDDRKGRHAVNLQHHTLDADGYPHPFGLPAGANQWFLPAQRPVPSRGLRVGQHLRRGREGCSMQPHCATTSCRCWRRPGPMARRWWRCPARAWTAPSRKSATRPYGGYGALWPFAQAQSMPWLRLSMALRGQDVEALRHDPCCHYSVEGHAALAQVFAEDAAQRLTQTPPDPPPEALRPTP